MKHENIRKLNNAGMYLIRLLFSVLHSKEIPSLPQTLDWETIYEMAKKHSVEVMAFLWCGSIDQKQFLFIRPLEKFQRHKHASESAPKRTG